jgi:predicted DNA-binding transcriptional regulator AlpA
MHSNMRPKLTPKFHEIHTALADVALIDAAAASAAGGISISTWHNLVRLNLAPQPLRFGPRCTRWKASDVRAWIIQRCEEAQANTQTREFVIARAQKASNAAKAKRTTPVITR